MGFSSGWPYAPVLIVGALLLFGGSVFVGACDMLTGPTLQAGNNSEASSPEHATLAHDHMPTGASLPSPLEVPLKNGTLRAYGRTQDSTGIISMAVSDSSSADTSSVESPYGCYLATQPYSPTVTFRSVYLYFPGSIVEAAGNETKRVIFSLQAVPVEDSSDVAGNLEEAVERRERTGIRYANCVIPAASGAQSLATEQLLRVGEDEATRNVLAASESAASKAAAYEQNCNVQEVTTCAGWSGNESCSTEHELVCSPSVPGGDGEGDGGPDGGDGDGGYPGGGSGPPGGGGDGDNDENCTHDPEPGSDSDPCDPCESSNPPSYCGSDVNDNKRCPSDPLEDMDIRATCAGIEGGRFGGRGEDHEGLDLLADVGTDLHSTTGGVVRRVAFDEGGWGNYVVIESTVNNRFFLYAHLNLVDLERGNSVSEGEVIGETGTSGNACPADCSCGPAHVHLEVREGASQWYNAEPQNPEDYLGTQFGGNGKPISDSCSS